MLHEREQRVMVGERAQWHPIMACEEYEPGRWVMIPQYGQPYAMIMIVRHGAEVGYRVDTWAQQPKDRMLIGYFTRLRAAAAAGHQRFVQGHTKPNSRPLSGHDFSRVPGKANTPSRTERD